MNSLIYEYDDTFSINVINCSACKEEHVVTFIRRPIDIPSPKGDKYDYLGICPRQGIALYMRIDTSMVINRG